jgi:hypothetical protein
MSTWPSLKPAIASRCSLAERKRLTCSMVNGVVLQALGEGAEVLLGEDRGRRQHQHLLAVVGGLERRAQRDLGLAVADVAADQRSIGCARSMSALTCSMASRWSAVSW